MNVAERTGLFVLALLAIGLVLAGALVVALVLDFVTSRARERRWRRQS